MTRAVLVLAVAAACHGKPGFEAKGSIVFANDVAGDIELFLATEGEILRSQSLTARVIEQRGSGAALAPDQVTVHRRSGTTILDVGVAAADPQQAQMLCNSLLRAYAEQRLSQKIMAIDVQLEALSRRLDDPKAEHRDELIRQAEALTTKRDAHENDVRLLDPCVTR